MKTYLLKDKCTNVHYCSNLNFIKTNQNHSVFIIDKTVHSLYKKELSQYISNNPHYIFEASENNKNINYLSKIYDFFQFNNVNRSTMVYGIGGGVTTDIAAFAASTYMRGCRLNLIPTTFLAMIDSAIGGKTAINFHNIKNNLGTFFPAENVYIYPEFIKTLPEKEIMNGWAECIKISLMNHNELYDEILNADKIITERIIEKAIDLKFSICLKDPEDKNERRILNLGHTFGHIIEKLTDFTTPHGIAVALGIRAAALLSLKEELIDSTDFNKITSILDQFGFPKKTAIAPDINSLELIEQILYKDKKTSYNQKELEINLIIFSEFQNAVQKKIPLEKIYNILQDIIS